MTNKSRTPATRNVAMSRLNFDFTDKAIKQLDNLKNKLGVTSRAEVVRYAQGILNWAVQQAEQGNQLVSVSSSTGTVKVLSVPPLDEIRNRVVHTRADKRGIRSLFSKSNDRWPQLTR